MRRHTYRSAIAVVASALLASGLAIGPRTLAVSRTEYNRVLQQTAKEAMLLNLVRLQYSEPPEFMDVSSITQQYTFGGESNVGTHSMFPRSQSWLADASASETPTVAYARST